MKIELKKVKYYESMSEETACFEAEIYANGKKIGYCKNNGQGGETDVHCWDMKTKDIFFEAEAYCRTLPPAFVGEKMTISNSLSDVVDELFGEWLKAKDNKRLEKNCEKGICHTIFVNDEMYEVTTWKQGGKTITIKELLNHPKGLETLKDCCTKLKGQGRRILNKNLPFEV